MTWLVTFYHTSDSGESILDKDLSYQDARAAMKRYAAQWATMSGTVVQERDRIEYRGDGWGSAVYVEKEVKLELKEEMEYLDLIDYCGKVNADLLRSWEGNLVVHDHKNGGKITKYWRTEAMRFSTVKPEPVCQLP